MALQNWFLVSHKLSASLAHNAGSRVLPFYVFVHGQLIFGMKEVGKHDGRMISIRYEKDAVHYTDMHV